MDKASVIEPARSSLLSYCAAMNQNYEAPRHLVDLARILRRVESGELKRVIVTIAPRHGKSMQVSQYFPAWYLGRNPSRYLIASSYGQDLSDDFGRKVRDQLEDPLFTQIFPECKISPQSHAANRFQTVSGGTYFAVGAGGPITGRGADLFLIDDPTKNREEAESPTMRHKMREWYKSVAYTRLMPGGAICVVMQRWNKEDLAGYLLKEHAHENWTVYEFPAINDVGEALWPEAYPVAVLEKIKKTAGPYNWASQYQQRPIDSETRVLNVDKITGYDHLPKLLMVLTSCDPAISKSTKACNTAFSTLGYGDDGHIYDLETVAGHWSFFETLEEAKMILQRQRSQYLGVESNQYQQALAEACQRYFPLVQVVNLKAFKDKFTRAKSVSHIIDQGLFHTNNRELLDEIRNFDPLITGEAKKDRVDAVVHGLHMLQQYAPMLSKDADPFDKLRDMTPERRWYELTRQYRKSQLQGDQGEVFNESDGPSDPEYY